MCSDRANAGCRERGFTTLEVLAAAALALVVAIAGYSFLDTSRQTFTTETGLAAAQGAGRSALDVLVEAARVAGYSPSGARFDAVAAGTASAVRLLADLDGDGLVAGGGEDMSFVFTGPDGGGEYELRWGADLDGDGSFNDPGESSESIATHVVPIDVQGDGTPDAFLTYEPAPPATTRVSIAFGVRTAQRDARRRGWPVVPFKNVATVRNRITRDDPSGTPCGNL